MQNWKKWNNCTIFWWVVAIAAGIATYSGAASATTWASGIMMGIAVAIFVGFGMTRFFCQGTGAGVNTGLNYTRPAIGSDTPSIATAAARTALQAGPDYAPPAGRVFGTAVKPPSKPPSKPASKPSAKSVSKAEAAAPKQAPASTEAKPKTVAKSTEPATKSPAKAPKPEKGPEPAEAADIGTKPAALDKPRGGKADNLKEIKGIGPKLEKLCNSLGFYHFDQIADWTPDELAWVDANLEGFKGRVSRDKWIAQAKILAAGGATEFSKRVEGGDVY